MSEHDGAARDVRLLIERMGVIANDMWEHALDVDGRAEYVKRANELCAVVNNTDTLPSTVALLVVTVKCLDKVFTALEIELVLEDVEEAAGGDGDE